MSQDQDQYQSQVESKASDSVRITEPVASSETNQDPSKLADDMIEGVSARSVAISARSAMAGITSRAISSPYDVAKDVSERIKRTDRSQSRSHDLVDFVRIAESDSDGPEHSDPTSHWRSFTQEPNATGPLFAAYDGIRQLV